MYRLRNVLFLQIVALILICLSSGKLYAADTQMVTLAVVPFHNVCGDVEWDWVGYGFAETLSTKLANVSSITLVERLRLDDAIKELKLQSSGLCDEKRAAQLGKMVGAQFVIIGSYQRCGGLIKADARKVDVTTGTVSNGVDAVGPVDRVFDVESALASKVVKSLDGGMIYTNAEDVIPRDNGSSTAYEYSSRGYREYQLGRADKAIEYMDKAIQSDPNYAQAYFYKGLIYQILRRDYDRAISNFDKAIELRPNNVEYRLTRGNAYDSGKHIVTMALADYDKVIEMNPRYAAGYMLRGKAYQRTHEDSEKALEDYYKALEVNPRNPMLHFLIAETFSHRPEPDLRRAVAEYSTAVDLDPGFVEAYDKRASAYYKMGRMYLAMKDWQKRDQIRLSRRRR